MKRSWIKTVLFTVIVNGIVLTVMCAVAEFGLRWRLEGSARAAFTSFFTTPESDGDGGRPTWLVYDRALGYKLNPSNPGINSLGIRHGDIPPDKPPALFRVVVLGDSVAWEDAGFVGLLRKRFGSIRAGPVEVINAAVPGYTTYQERVLLERDLLAVKPDLVIVQYCLNDNHRFLHKLNKSGRWLITPEAERVLDPEGHGPLVTLLRSSRVLVEIRLRLLASRFFSRSRFPWDLRADLAAAWQDETWPDVEEQLRVMHDRSNALGARFAVVAVPWEPQLRQDLLDRDRSYTLKPQRKLQEICARLNVPLLDLYQAFLANRDRAPFRDGMHLTAAGHEIVVRQLLEFLQREKLAT